MPFINRKKKLLPKDPKIAFPKESNRELCLKQEGEQYARVTKILGGNLCEVFCFDGETRVGKIRGNMMNRIFLKTGFTVLVSLREFGKEKENKKNLCDIIYKYERDEVIELLSSGEIPYVQNFSGTERKSREAAED